MGTNGWSATAFDQGRVKDVGVTDHIRILPRRSPEPSPSFNVGY